MASSLTQKGQEYMLLGTATPNGGIANMATKVKLYSSASTPNKDGTGFTEVGAGNGYATGGHTIARSDFAMTLDVTNNKLTLDDQVWTASGGTIPNIAGAYITDGSGNVLAWWERPTTTLASGDDITLTGLSIEPT